MKTKAFRKFQPKMRASHAAVARQLGLQGLNIEGAPTYSDFLVGYAIKVGVDPLGELLRKRSQRHLFDSA